MATLSGTANDAGGGYTSVLYDPVVEIPAPLFSPLPETLISMD